ncbi:2-oxoglutarate dehydrogenase, E2 component, dihydrolipoamide succinyltransferase [Actinomadura sp. B10D3]|uniref:2-oxoglutarate dehydrogenase, E2 component, dihydrolipoamide succinyltransferase n=1 Tax=Actinomadura sp. B10D3 TaxID=3153557 RepID=UPI00325EDB32
MAVPVTMPQLGESVTEGTVTRWLKQVGEHVEADEPLLEVSTDKVDTEIPAPVSGVLRSISVQEDETVATGTELARIGAAERVPEPAAATVPGPPPASPAAGPAPASAAPPVPAGTPPAAPASHRTGAPGRRRTGGGHITPFVRRLAFEHGVDLASVRPAKPGDRIRRQDVLAARKSRDEAVPASPAGPVAGRGPEAEGGVRGTTGVMDPARRALAARLKESLRTSAHLTTVVEADVTKIVEWCASAGERFRAREGIELTPRPFLALAALAALAESPEINCRVDPEAGVIVHPDGRHLAVTVDVPGGTVKPVIRDAASLNLAGLAHALADLSERARAGRLDPAELTGGTFTLADTGAAGALFATAVIDQPQVAVLCTGAIGRRPVVVRTPALGEVVAVRSMVHLALTYDHRVIDGADAARFLERVRKRLETGDLPVGPGL